MSEINSLSVSKAADAVCNVQLKRATGWDEETLSQLQKVKETKSLEPPFSVFFSFPSLPRDMGWDQLMLTSAPKWQGGPSTICRGGGGLSHRNPSRNRSGVYPPFVRGGGLSHLSHLSLGYG